MSKRALLIGSQTYGLTGANPDVCLMTEALERRGFDCRVLIDDDASRHGIIEAYEQLIGETSDGSEEPVVVYYSGHGGRSPLAQSADRERRGRRSHLRYLVPFDMEASTATDFRGLLAEELSALQRRLTARTANVTTILDCCHSGTMSRDPSVRPKSVAREFSIDGALALLDTIDDTVSPATKLDDSNALAVRVVACDPLQSAYERPSSRGGTHGALTDELVLLLTELGDRPVTWRVLADRLRRTITTTIPMQRPEVEGPADRIVFALTNRSVPGALPVSVRDGVARIDAARLLGVSVGDTYDVRAEDDTALGKAEVTSIENDHAVLDVQRADGAQALPADAVAVPRRTARTRPVGINTTASVGELVTAAVGASTLLRVAAANEAPLATIVEDRGLVVLDPEGFSVQSEPFGTERRGVHQAIALVERIAKAERIRSLASSPASAGLPGTIDVELASHADGVRTVRARSGERLYVGERISVKITNGGERDVFVGLLDVNTSYDVQMLNGDEPAGWRLAAGATKVVGGEHGVGLVWDDGVPGDGERPETFVVIASATPLDFRMLETPRGDRGAEESPRNELESLLEEARSGLRGWPSPGAVATDSGYEVKAVDFYLTPGPKPAGDCG